METHPVSINAGIITIKTYSISVKDVATMAIIAMIGTILTIITVNNLGVLQ